VSLELFEEISLVATVEDVETGNVKTLRVEKVGTKATKYGERFYLEGRSEDNNKWTVWLRQSDVVMLKRALMKKKATSVKALSVTLDVEEYTGRDGQKKKRVVIKEVQ